MERQEGILQDVLWNGFACRSMGFHEARLVLVHRFDELMNQIVREIGSPDRKIIHSDGDIVLVQKAVGPGGYFRETELRNRFSNGFNLRGGETEEYDRLLRLDLLDRRHRRPGQRHDGVVATGKKLGGRDVE